MASGKGYNAYATAQAEFDRIAGMIDLDDGARALLRRPLREYHFGIPVRMDDGQVQVFRGFRVQHNDARGPCKGGIRFHPQETADTVRAQAMWMTWKSALADLPLGGGKGGIVCDPHNLSPREQEALCRGWVRQISRDVGPHRDVPATDVMTSAQHMLWMLDEYEALHGGHYPGFITGKPVGLGGSLGRKQATGYGLVYALREALRELDLEPADTTMSIQGFGNVGQHVVELYHRIGGRTVSVSCWDQKDQTSYAYRKRDGVDLAELRKITDAFGGIDRAKAADLGYEVLPGEQWLEQEVDILVPAALENQLTAETVGRIPGAVRLVAEGANGPTTPEGDAALTSRGVFVIPDFLANSGGVTCSYFEGVQSNMNYYWELGEVLSKLDVKMTSAFHDVHDLADRRRLPMRDAAYVLAIGRVAGACRDRGWI